MKATLVFCLMVFSCTGLLNFSPLRLLEDLDTDDIFITYVFDAGASSINFRFQFYQALAKRGISSYCFRKTGVSHSGEQCSLTNRTANYDCIRVTYNSNISYTFTHYVVASDLSTLVGSQTQFIPTSQSSAIINATQIYSFILTGTINGATLQIIAKDSIYEMASVNSATINSNQAIKKNFVNSFVKKEADNLIMQRHYACSFYTDLGIYNFVFTGGAVRNALEIFFISFLSFQVDVTQNNTFSMWSGLSFCSDHANRDYVGAAVMEGEAQDLFSLFAAAPYLDTSGNIRGTNDLTLVSVSQTEVGKTVSDNFYFLTTYRLYDTLDTKGDEIIRNKINNQYCLVAMFSTSQNVSMPITSSGQHDLLYCFEPNIQLFQNFPSGFILGVVFFVLSITL